MSEEHSPGFTCPDCKRSVGARKPSETAPWEPQPCFWCSRRKAQRDAAKRRREAPRVLAGVDVDAAVAWMLTLPVLAELIPKCKNGRKLQVDVGHRAIASYSGRAWSNRFKIRIAAGPRATAAQVLEVALHELVHIATPQAHHNERFCRVLQRALREAWRVEVPLDVERGNENNKAYAMDRLAMAALDTAIKLGEVNIFPPKPAEPKPRGDEPSARRQARRTRCYDARSG